MRAPVLPVLSLALSTPIQPEVASMHQPEEASVWKLVEPVQKYYDYNWVLFIFSSALYSKNSNWQVATFWSVSRIGHTAYRLH